MIARFETDILWTPQMLTEENEAIGTFTLFGTRHEVEWMWDRIAEQLAFFDKENPE